MPGRVKTLPYKNCRNDYHRRGDSRIARKGFPRTFVGRGHDPAAENGTFSDFPEENNWVIPCGDGIFRRKCPGGSMTLPYKGGRNRYYRRGDSRIARKDEGLSTNNSKIYPSSVKNQRFLPPSPEGEGLGAPRPSATAFMRGCFFLVYITSCFLLIIDKYPRGCYIEHRFFPFSESPGYG